VVDCEALAVQVKTRRLSEESTNIYVLNLPASYLSQYPMLLEVLFCCNFKLQQSQNQFYLAERAATAPVAARAAQEQLLDSGRWTAAAGRPDDPGPTRVRPALGRRGSRARPGARDCRCRAPGPGPALKLQVGTHGGLLRWTDPATVTVHGPGPGQATQ
jgi:hypothetical protein